MKADDLSDEQILYLVGETDRLLFEGGADINKRTWEVPRSVMHQLGFISYVMSGVGKPKVLTRIEEVFSSIYRPQDIAVGGHIGVFMYRDIFARLSVPMIFGRTGFNPFRFVDLTPVQLRMIQHEPTAMATYLDQFSDVADVQYGAMELKPEFGRIDLLQRFIHLARLHLHAAAAVLTGGYDFDGAVQSALLACELALKGAVAGDGSDEATLRRRFGHRLNELADEVAQLYPRFDLARVRRVMAAQPKYVSNRYAPDHLDRRAIGHVVMGAQYLVSEVVRQLSDRDFRSGAQPPHERCYPA